MNIIQNVSLCVTLRVGKLQQESLFWNQTVWLQILKSF